MPHRRPPGQPDDDRRHDVRREEDVETRDLAEHALENEPIVSGLLKTWRVAVAVAGLTAVLSVSLAAVGFRMAGPKEDIAKLAMRIDTSTAHIYMLEQRDRAQRDSVFATLGSIEAELRDLKSGDLRELRLTQCQMMRRLAPDLRPSDTCK